MGGVWLRGASWREVFGLEVRLGGSCPGVFGSEVRLAGVWLRCHKQMKWADQIARARNLGNEMKTK